jgi:hypothetical protein
VTGLVTDLASLVTDPVLAIVLRNSMYLSGESVKEHIHAYIPLVTFTLATVSPVKIASA